MATRTTAPGTKVATDFLSAANFNDTGGALVVYAKAVANQTTITTGSNLTSLTSGAWTPTQNRIFRITWKVTISLTAGAGATDQFSISLLKDGSAIDASFAQFATAFGITMVGVTIDVAPVASSHTYLLQGARSSGTATYQVVASSTQPAWLLIEDVGPSF